MNQDQSLGQKHTLITFAAKLEFYICFSSKIKQYALLSLKTKDQISRTLEENSRTHFYCLRTFFQVFQVWFNVVWPKNFFLPKGWKASICETLSMSVWLRFQCANPRHKDLQFCKMFAINVRIKTGLDISLHRSEA